MAAAGLLVLPACSSSTSNSKERSASADDQNPEIGLQLYTVRDLISKDLKGTIEAVSTVGYDYVELFGYANRQYFGMSVADFYNLLSNNELRVVSSHHVSGRVGNKEQGTLLNGWDQAIEDAVSVGQEFMVCSWLFPEERTSMESYKELTEILNQAGEKCKNAGIQFCYHNHDFEFMELEGEIPMYHVLDNTDPEYVKMELDLYWITKAGYDPIAFFEKYPGRTPLWHVKDMEDSEDKSFADVGEGTIDFRNIFANAEKSGMKSFFVEQDVSDDPMASIKTSYKNLATNILSKA